jgi:3-hydroxyisobutyrate dehydrogenase-like beta-hydroxyacid dehydrogenase
MSATPVTVVGAGKMGSALARALLTGGYAATVWNRTPARVEPLREAGAAIAADLKDAIAASEVTVMSVANQAVVGELLEAADAPSTLRSKTLIQLTTGTPADGRRGQEFARDHKIAYLDGAIMAYPRTIGTDAAVILFSGDPEVFSAHEPMLRALGTPRYAGPDAGQAAVSDAALLAFFFATVAGFLHGANLSRAAGIEIGDYLAQADRFFKTFITDAVNETAERIAAGNYGDAQSTTETDVAAIDLLIVEASREAGIDPSVMAAISDSFGRIVSAGRGDEAIAALADLDANQLAERAP